MNSIAKNRLESFSDGVFTIMITLLIFPLLETFSQASNLKLPVVIKNNTSSILIYIFSYLIIGIYWLNHHQLFQIISKINIRIVWYNLFYLLAMSFISVSTAIVGKYTNSSLAAAIYGINLLFANAFSFLIIWELMKNKSLVHSNVDKKIFTLFKKFYPIKGAIYMAGIFCSLLNPIISYIIYFAVNAFMVYLSFNNTTLKSDV